MQQISVSLFILGGGASNDGKSYGIWQFSNVKPSTKFTVVSHGPTHTTIKVEGDPNPKDIPHTDENRRQIKNFSKCWKTPALANRPPSYLEAGALLWGLDITRFWSLSSPFPLYAQSDHLPLKWIKHSEKVQLVRIKSHVWWVWAGCILTYRDLQIIKTATPDTQCWVLVSWRHWDSNIRSKTC